MRTGILTILFFSLFSCGDNKTPVIENRDKTVDIIIDLQTIKEVVNIYPHEMKDSINGILMNKFYEIHAIDSLALMELFAGMRKDPELLKELHEESLEKINRLKVPR